MNIKDGFQDFSSFKAIGLTEGGPDNGKTLQVREHFVFDGSSPPKRIALG
jgi:hypothetical protein